MIPALGARRRGAPVVVYSEDPIPYSMPTSAPWNPPSTCIVPTYDGSDVFVHASIVDMQAEIGGVWRGYRFWMAFTPYPASNSAYENPSIVASNNGYHWHVPNGLTNPVVPKPTVGYNSDPDLLWNPDLGRMEMIYRPMDAGEDVKILHSANGVEWSTPTLLINDPPGGIISPSLIRVSASEWRIYARTQTGNIAGMAYWTATSPDGPWGGRVACSVTGPMPLDTTSQPYFWHLKVIKVAGTYYAAAITYPAGGTLIYPGTSTDGATFTYGEAIISPRPGMWDSAWLYRPTIVPHENGTHMRLWYTGPAARYTMGYTIVPLTLWPTV